MLFCFDVLCKRTVIHFSVYGLLSPLPFLPQESGDGKVVSESKESDGKRGAQIPIKKMGQMSTVPRRSSEEKNKDTLSVSCSSESTTKSGNIDALFKKNS